MRSTEMRQTPRRSRLSDTPESVMARVFITSVVLVGLMTFAQSIGRIEASDLQRSSEILPTLSSEILRALTRITFYDKDSSSIKAGCSSTTIRETQVLENTMYTTLLIGHCIDDFKPENSNTDLINIYMTEPIRAKTILCQEYNHSAQAEDNITLCSHVTKDDNPELIALDKSLVDFSYAWKIGDAVTLVGFPGDSNNFSSAEAVAFADQGTINNIGRINFNGGEIGCGDYEAFSGESGGPELVNGRVVGVHRGGCLGFPEISSDGGVDIPADYPEFEEDFYQSSLCKALGQSCP